MSAAGRQKAHQFIASIANNDPNAQNLSKSEKRDADDLLMVFFLSFLHHLSRTHWNSQRLYGVTSSDRDLPPVPNQSHSSPQDNGAGHVDADDRQQRRYDASQGGGDVNSDPFLRSLNMDLDSRLQQYGIEYTEENGGGQQDSADAVDVDEYLKLLRNDPTLGDAMLASAGAPCISPPFPLSHTHTRIQILILRV